MDAVFDLHTTIPAHIREKLGILPECEVFFQITGDAVLIRKSPGARCGTSLISRMRGKASSRLSTDQIMALTRG